MCYSIMIVDPNLGTIADRYVPKKLKLELDSTTRQNELFTYYHVSGFEHPRLPIIANNTIEFMEWGLIPRFSREFKHSDLELLNARNETASTLPTFKNAWKDRKFGILPVNAFYESQDRDGVKIPYLIYDLWVSHLNLAVLYEEWFDIEWGTYRKSFAILTTEAAGIVRDIHNIKLRMPVILPDGYLPHWLNKDISENDAKWLASYQYTALEANTISKLANNARAFRNTPEVAQYYEYTEKDFDFERITKQAKKREGRK